MNNELLITDMCGRLQHHVMCEVSYKDSEGYKKDIMELKGYLPDSQFFFITENGGSIYSSDFKPYLRPMSSMTEEETDTYDRLVMSNAPWVVDDWLNAHHFDYRGLIEKGLALEAPEDMYKVNNE